MQSNHARSWQRDYIERQQQQQKKVVKKVKKRKILTKGEKIIYTFFSMIVLIAAIYIVSFASTTDGLNRDIQKLESEVQQHKVVNKDLAFEISELSKPERITKIAKENGLKIQEAKVKRVLTTND